MKMNDAATNFATKSTPACKRPQAAHGMGA